MAFQYLTNVPLERARREFRDALRCAGFGPEAETIPVQDACGRITAEPVYARICAPHYPACAMDGIALEARATFGATETTPVTLGAEAFTAVDTGDPVPEGCDAVVMAEDVVGQEDGSVRLHAAAVPWQHIRQIGEDICAGEMILASHVEISPSAMGAMLAAGVLEAAVLRRPVVGIIPTGDEVVPPTASPEPGDVVEFNSAIFSAMLVQWGAEPRTFPIVPDERAAIRAAVEEALSQCDVVLLNAGSSAGREDYSAAVLGEVGEVLFHGIAMKPGKPAILGHRGGKPLLGVPGYPVSGILVLTELLRPLLEDWYQAGTRRDVHREAVLSRPVVSGLKYQEFVRVRLRGEADRVPPGPGQRGGVLLYEGGRHFGGPPGRGGLRGREHGSGPPAAHRGGSGAYPAGHREPRPPAGRGGRSAASGGPGSPYELHPCGLHGRDYGGAPGGDACRRGAPAG